MAWLLCDYGDVISRSQTPEDVTALAGLLGLDDEEFGKRYWAERVAYDRGDLDAVTFWSGVASGPVDDETVAACVAVDVASWTRLDEASLAAVEAAGARGFRLALLSNAPAEIARALDSHPWFARFEHRIFSCDLRLAKPDAAIFEATLARLGATASDVTFVDDREPNVAAAAALGIRALLYTGPSVLAAL